MSEMSYPTRFVIEPKYMVIYKMNYPKRYFYGDAHILYLMIYLIYCHC